MESLKSIVFADSGQAAVNGKCCWQVLDMSVSGQTC